MMFTAVAALFAAASFVSAATHNVVVGDGGLTYTPNQIKAEVGDIVTFEFKAKNHTVTQSAFADPCHLLVNATTNQVGFDSGFVPVANGSSSVPTWSIQVTATAPIWFYCKQATHCQMGMVGAINAPATGPKTFQAFQALAMSGASNTTSPPPTGVTPSGGAGVGASASGSVQTDSPSPSESASSSSNNSNNSENNDSAAANLKVTNAGLVLVASAALATFTLF